MKHNANRRTFYILLALSLASVVCVLPYVLTIQGDLIRSVDKPLPLLLAVQVIQSAILFVLAIYFGLSLTRKIGFSLPILEGEPGSRLSAFKRITGSSMLVGIACAVTIYVLDYFFALGGTGISTHQNLAPAWQKLLAAVYGGVAEEIIMRLFIMTLFIRIGMKLARQERPSMANIIASMTIAAVIFGLGHLPITASVTSISALVVGRAIVLNGIGGLAFGWLFWKKGFESAVIAHFTADIFLLTLLPMIMN